MGKRVFSPIDIFRILARHEVKYVLIGALAGTLHGSPIATQDVDICPDRSEDNMERLARALQEMDARVYTSEHPDGFPFATDATMLKRNDIWNLVTPYGRFDISIEPTGTRGYADLSRKMTWMEIGGVKVPVADLRDVIRSKEAAGREKDDRHIPTLRKLLERLNHEEQ